MGRVKLKIKRLESTTNRQVTYSKRRNGILKKARELSILCDIDSALLMFSPTGRPTLFHGDRSKTEDVIAKFAQVSPQERAKRNLESLEALKKTFKKLDHDVIVQDFLGSSSQTIEVYSSIGATIIHDHDSSMAFRLTKSSKTIASANCRIIPETEVHYGAFLGFDIFHFSFYWNDPAKVDNIEYLTQMERSLRESVDRVRIQKETIAKHQVMSLGCPALGGVALPMMTGDAQAGLSFAWFSNNDNQHMSLAKDSNFVSPRTMACSQDVVQGFDGYFGLGKQTAVVNSGQFDNTGHEGSSLNDLSSSGGAMTELSSSGSLSLQPTEQYPCTPYSSLSFPQDKQLKHEMEMNLQGNPGVNEVNSNFLLPTCAYDATNDTWVPTSQHCAISMFNDKSYQQQPN
ncbi:hypothetical protein ACFE04_009173 [Oxalis oulophora]